MAMVTEEKKNIAARIGDGVGAAMGAVDMTQKWKNQKEQLEIQRAQLGQQKEAMIAQQAQAQEKLTFDSNVKQSELLGSFLKSKDKDKWMQVNAGTLKKINGYTGGAPIDDTRLLQISAVEQEELGTFLSDVSSMTRQIQTLPSEQASLGKLDGIMKRRDELMNMANAAPEAMEPFVLESIKQLDSAASKLQQQIADQKEKETANVNVDGTDMFTKKLIEAAGQKNAESMTADIELGNTGLKSQTNYNSLQEILDAEPEMINNILGAFKGQDWILELRSMAPEQLGKFGFSQKEQQVVRQVQQLLGTERAEAIKAFAAEAGARAIDSERELELFMASLVRLNSDPEALKDVILLKKAQAARQIAQSERAEAYANDAISTGKAKGVYKADSWISITDGKNVRIMQAGADGKLPENTPMPEGFKTLDEHLTARISQEHFDAIDRTEMKSYMQGSGSIIEKPAKVNKKVQNLFSDLEIED